MVQPGDRAHVEKTREQIEADARCSDATLRS